MMWTDNLQGIGFRPFKAEPHLWMRCRGNYYEYISVMVDDLLIFSKEPELTVESIIYLFNFNWKGVGEPEYFLLHLLTHLSYHIGQINYHRRFLTKE